MIRFLLFSGGTMLSWNKSYCWDGNKSLWSRALLAAFLFPLYTCISLPFSQIVIVFLQLLSIQSSTCLQVCLTPAACLYRQLWKTNLGKSSCTITYGHAKQRSTAIPGSCPSLRTYWVTQLRSTVYCSILTKKKKNNKILEKAPYRVQARASDMPWLACTTPKQPSYARQITQWGFHWPARKAVVSVTAKQALFLPDS